MMRWISVVGAGFVGAVLAAFAGWGVISASTAAPDHNPATTQVIDYGAR